VARGQQLPRARTRTRRTAWLREPWPIILGKGGACNGVVLFEDGGALPAGGQAVAPPGIGMAPAAGRAVKAGVNGVLAGG
jgi:hypothetical protein